MPVYIIARGLQYIREGIDDVGDIYEIFDGPEPPGGPGYALSDIIEINPLTREDIDNKMAELTPSTEYDEKADKDYWQDPESGNWYEIKVNPKYSLNVADLTLEDKVILANPLSTSVAQYAVLDKIKANLTKYADNFTTLKPS